jgi:plasmid stabilization system protein ParE
VSAFTLSRRAQVQLADIIRYTAHRWGPAQADTYRVTLRSCFAAMASGTAHMTRIAAPGGPYLRHRCRHHVIFAISSAGPLRIISVFHERMDAQSWLANEQ